MFFGYKTVSWFDVWSIQHLLFAITLTSYTTFNICNGSWPRRISLPKRFQILTSSFVLAYLWETIEYGLETGLGSETILFWFQGHEYWVNRFIIDPIILVSGGYFLFFAFRSIIVVRYSRLFTYVWLTFHTLVFPHCMYLHEARAWKDWRTWAFVYVLATVLTKGVYEYKKTIRVDPEELLLKHNTVPPTSDGG